MLSHYAWLQNVHIMIDSWQPAQVDFYQEVISSVVLMQNVTARLILFLLFFLESDRFTQFCFRAEAHDYGKPWTVSESSAYQRMAAQVCSRWPPTASGSFTDHSHDSSVRKRNMKCQKVYRVTLTMKVNSHKHWLLGWIRWCFNWSVFRIREGHSLNLWGRVSTLDGSLVWGLSIRQVYSQPANVAELKINQH